MHALSLHPDCEPGPVSAITAGIRAMPGGCEAEFVLRGALEDIQISEAGPSVRTDELWKTTCCEIFWQKLGASAYREFNLSPSSRWAAYDFDDAREGMRDAPVEAVELATRREAGALHLSARIASVLPVPARVALTAVVALRDGALQYWALAFPAGPPDFHSAACRQLTIKEAL